MMMLHPTPPLGRATTRCRRRQLPRNACGQPLRCARHPLVAPSACARRAAATPPPMTTMAHSTATCSCPFSRAQLSLRWASTRRRTARLLAMPPTAAMSPRLSPPPRVAVLPRCMLSAAMQRHIICPYTLPARRLHRRLCGTPTPRPRPRPSPPMTAFRRWLRPERTQPALPWNACVSPTPLGPVLARRWSVATAWFCSPAASVRTRRRSRLPSSCTSARTPRRSGLCAATTAASTARHASGRSPSTSGRTRASSRTRVPTARGVSRYGPGGWHTVPFAPHSYPSCVS